MAVDPDAERLQLFLVGDGGGLACEAGQDDASDHQAVCPEFICETEQVHVVGDAEIAADLVLLDIARVNGDNNFTLIPQLAQHPDLGVRLKARKDAGGVIVVKKLAAEFHVELAAECVNPVADVFRLRFQIFLVVKTDLLH